MDTRPYTIVEIKKKEQLIKNKAFSSSTEIKKDGRVLAQLWFYDRSRKCYYIARDSRGKELTLKYISSLNKKLNEKREEIREKKTKSYHRYLERYNHFYEKPGIRFEDGYVLFSPRSPLSGSTYDYYYSVRPTPGWDYVCYFFTINQYFAWIKAVVFDDFTTAYRIESSKNSKKAIELGRTVCNFDDEHWKSIREDIMISILIRRWYSTDSNDDTLVDPVFENRHFINADPNDRIWGIGYGIKDAMAHKDEWGENLLGKCYDRLREILSDKETHREEYEEYWGFYSANGTRILDGMPW